MSTETRTDIYSRVTNKIIADLEKGVWTWQKSWNAEHAAGRITNHPVALPSDYVLSARRRIAPAIAFALFLNGLGNIFVLQSERFREVSTSHKLAGRVVAPGGAAIRGPAVPWNGRRHGRRQHRRWARTWSPAQI